MTAGSPVQIPVTISATATHSHTATTAALGS